MEGAEAVVVEEVVPEEAVTQVQAHRKVSEVKRFRLAQVPTSALKWLKR